MICNSEKPWYYSSVVAFLRDDVPRLLEIPPAAFARDVTRLEQRLSCEGESFLTKTLPALGKLVDRALQGHVQLNPSGFRKLRGSSLPVFLQALTLRVFEKTGWLRGSPCIKSIRLLRQICFWCKKVEKGYSDESLQRAITDFKEVDDCLPNPDAILAKGYVGIARFIIEHVFKTIGSIPIRPGHGPGAVASGDSAVGKRKLLHSYEELESVFRPIPWFRSLRDAAESPQSVLGRMHCAYGLSRTEFVEKDSSGPRTIGLEPAEYMWCQQAVKRWLYDHIENSSCARGHVNFTDQEINRNLALEPEQWDTLDMSKASDRNSYALVRTLFENTRVWPYLRASRTPGTVLPNGEILMYKKFAPMGSAVCFPVQACVYYALACSALHIQGVPLSLALSSVYVYGDDLIVPRGYFPTLKRVFEGVHLKFNLDKCCIHGLFRESCGMDAFNSQEVTPKRMRRVYESRGRTIIPSLVEHANGLALAGYWAASVAFRKACIATYPNIRRMRIPLTTRVDLPILAWYDSYLDNVRIEYKNSIPRVRGWVFEPKKLKCDRADEGAYLRESLSLGGPVGQLVSERSSLWSIGVNHYPVSRIVRRVLSAKYSGKLRRKSLPYWPSAEERTVAQRIERLAERQS